MRPSRCSIARDMGCILQGRRSSWSRQWRRCARVAASRATFMCSLQPNGRVGVKIPAGVSSAMMCWTRIRTARSACTTGLCVRAMRILPSLLYASARNRCSTPRTLLGISVARDNSVARLRADTAAGRIRSGRRRRHAAADGAGCWRNRQQRDPARAHGRDGSENPRPNRRTCCDSRCRSDCWDNTFATRCSPEPAAVSVSIRGGSRERPAPQKSSAPSRTPGSQGMRRTVPLKRVSPLP